MWPKKRARRSNTPQPSDTPTGVLCPHCSTNPRETGVTGHATPVPQSGSSVLPPRALLSWDAETHHRVVAAVRLYLTTGDPHASEAIRAAIHGRAVAQALLDGMCESGS